MRYLRGPARWLVVLCSILLFMAAGCGGGEQKKSSPPPTKIAVSLPDMDRDGNKTIKQVMKKRGQKEHLDIMFMDAKNDPAEQEKQIDEMLENDIKASIIQFIDPQSAPPLVQKLKKKNIKVVAFQNLPANTPLDAYVASDHSRTGQLQVGFVEQVMAMAKEGAAGEQAGGQGGEDPAQVTRALDQSVLSQLPPSRPLQVLILEGDSKDLAAQEMTAANIRAIEANPNLNLLRVQEHPRWDPASTTTALGELKAAGQEPHVVLANDSSLAMAAVDFFKQASMEKNVITVGVGADEKSSLAVLDGEHEGEVDPMPEMLAHYALDAARDLAKNEHWQFDRQIQNGDYDIPSKIVPVRLIGKGNIYLLQDRWKKLKQEQKKGQGEEKKEQDQQEPKKQDQEKQQGEQQDQQQKGTTLKITTEEGKTMEVKIDGTLKKIESTEEGGEGEGK